MTFSNRAGIPVTVMPGESWQIRCCPRSVISSRSRESCRFARTDRSTSSREESIPPASMREMMSIS